MCVRSAETGETPQKLSWQANKKRKMSFAADKLYNGYVRGNMSTIVSRVKVREIMIHLPCLTAHDRDTIEAKRETSGNYNGMVLLLDCLKRRENWPEQFISALEACEQKTLAAEIRAEYNTLKGVNNSNPGSLPATVVRAHVHPAPAASHLPVAESGGNGRATVSLAPEAPPETAAAVTPPQETPTQQQAPQNPAGQVVSPPESVPEPTQEAPMKLPSTPPPSPEIPRAQVNDAQLPRSEIASHQEPEENSESDIQNVSSGRAEVAASVVTTPPHRGRDSPSHPELLQTAASTNDKPQRAPSPAQIISDATDGSSFPTMTPEKHPVQDTTPPVVNVAAVVPQPEEVSEPPTTPIVERSPLPEAAATTSSGPLADGMEISPDDADDVCLSKPGQLLSVLTQNGASPTIASSGRLVEPYSGDSQRLEISGAAAAVTPATVPACSAVSSTAVDSVTALPCQENGVAPNHNEPEENHYESPCSSVEVLESVVHVSEEPSILNMDGQTASPQAETINGETPEETPSSQVAYSNAAEDNPSGLNVPGKESFSPSGPAEAHVSSEHESRQNAEAKTAPQTLITQSSNTKYIITAAGVCACALLIAWRFKK